MTVLLIILHKIHIFLSLYKREEKEEEENRDMNHRIHWQAKNKFIDIASVCFFGSEREGIGGRIKRNRPK